MKTNHRLALTLLTGAALGAAVITGLNAQAKAPGAYVVVDITDISDPEGFKALLPKAPPALAAFDGRFIARTEKITALGGAPPKRFIIIAFDSVDKANAWNDSPAQKEVNDIRLKSTKSRSFIVSTEGM